MKKILLICIGCFLFKGLDAQVRIGDLPIAADPSAILELDGGATRGLLLPRMRKLDMLAIPNPAEGLTVYLTDEQATYLRRQNDWIKLSGTGDAFSLPYNNQFNYDGNVLGLVNTFPNRAAILGQHLGDGYGVRGFSFHGIGINGTGQEADGIGGYFINGNAGGRSLISLGRTGIGTESPGNLLHIDGNDYPGTTVIIDDDTDPLIQLQRGGISRGFFQSVTDDVKIGTNATNNNGSFMIRTNGSDRLFVDNAGLTGIGSTSTGSKFYIDALGTSAIAMTINDQNPTLQLQNSGVDKGFVQLNGDDVRLGTNFSNPDGNVILRTGGLDQVKLNSDGRVSIGNPYGTPQGRLHIRGGGIAGLMLDDNFSSGSGPQMSFVRTNANNTINYLAMMYVTDEDFRISTTNRGFEVSDQISRPLFRVKGSNGYTGISTSNPLALLHVDGNTANVTGEVARFSGSNPTIQLQNVSDDVGFIQAAAQSVRIGTNAGNSVGEFIIRMNGTNRVWVDHLGNMSIGNTTFSSPPVNPYKLAVKGKIAGTEFVVETLGDWPDYVFDPSYKLMPLSEVEAFIQKNKHLPNILPAAIVEKEGFGIADMQKRMMEKIEELTLHLIEADKRIKELTEKVSKLESK